MCILSSVFTGLCLSFVQTRVQFVLPRGRGQGRIDRTCVWTKERRKPISQAVNFLLNWNIIINREEIGPLWSNPLCRHDSNLIYFGPNSFLDKSQCYELPQNAPERPQGCRRRKLACTSPTLPQCFPFISSVLKSILSQSAAARRCRRPRGQFMTANLITSNPWEMHERTYVFSIQSVSPPAFQMTDLHFHLKQFFSGRSQTLKC